MFNNLYKTSVLLLVCWHSLLIVCGKSTGKGWTDKKSEIYFLLDSSASMWVTDFNKMLSFVANLVADMDIGQEATRVGLGVFSSYHKLHIPINNDFSKEELQQQILNAPYLKGNTFISRALKGMMVHGLPSSIVRSGVPLITVLITDGMSRHKQLAADNATLAKNGGIFFFTIGIGNGVDKQELRDIASDPKLVYNYHVSDFDELNSIHSQLSFRMSNVDVFQGDEGTCGDKTKVDTVFVFDELALGEHDTGIVKGFIESVIKEFSMNTGNVRVGTVSTSCHEGDKTLGQYITKEDFTASLKSKDVPDISGLIKRARLESFMSENGARFDASHRLVLILHADARRRVDAVRQASRARHAGIETYRVIIASTNYVT